MFQSRNSHLAEIKMNKMKFRTQGKILKSGTSLKNLEQIEHIAQQKKVKQEFNQGHAQYKYTSRLLGGVNESPMLLKTPEVKSPVIKRRPQNREKMPVYDDILEGYYGKISEIKPNKSNFMSRNASVKPSRTTGEEAGPLDLKQTPK